MIEPEAFTFIEGGDWIPWGDVRREASNGSGGIRLHAIRFEDGAIFDAYNGWRRAPKRKAMIDDEELHDAAVEIARTHLGHATVDPVAFADAVLAILALERDAESRQARKNAGLAD